MHASYPSFISCFNAEPFIELLPNYYDVSLSTLLFLGILCALATVINLIIKTYLEGVCCCLFVFCLLLFNLMSPCPC